MYSVRNEEGMKDLKPLKRKSDRPRIVEIAKAAHVSTATVDRVLNNRPGVREATVIRVQAAAIELGYIFKEQVSGETASLVFLLPDGTNRYLHNLAGLLDSEHFAALRSGFHCECHLVKRFDAVAMAEAIRHHGGKATAIAVMALEHPLVREAINEVVRNGCIVVTIITDITHCNRHAYVGLNNHAAGRTAAYLMSRFCKQQKGDVAMIAGSLNYRAHNEREIGFLAYMHEFAPSINVIDSREGLDDVEKNYRLAKTLLKQHPNIIGIYSIGGGPAGIALALREEGKTESVTLIGHGLSDETRPMLLDQSIDMVIGQDPISLVQNVCQIVSSAKDGRTSFSWVPDLAMQIICSENLP